MKEKLKVLFCSVVFAVILLSTQVFATAKETNQYKYFVIYKDNNIEVFNTNDMSNPLYNIAFDVKILPENDRKSLDEGIFLKDENELKSIIEDFTG